MWELERMLIENNYMDEITELRKENSRLKAEVYRLTDALIEIQTKLANTVQDITEGILE